MHVNNHFRPKRGSGGARRGGSGDDGGETAVHTMPRSTTPRTNTNAQRKAWIEPSHSFLILKHSLANISAPGHHVVLNPYKLVIFEFFISGTLNLVRSYFNRKNEAGNNYDSRRLRANDRCIISLLLSRSRKMQECTMKALSCTVFKILFGTSHHFFCKQD